MKFKFKITEDTTLGDVEKELAALCEVPVPELPLKHIEKLVVDYLNAERVKSTGSMVRFKHPLAPTPGNYFGVHAKHKGGDEVLILKVNYKKYLYPMLVEIIRQMKVGNS